MFLKICRIIMWVTGCVFLLNSFIGSQGNVNNKVFTKPVGL